MILYLTHLMKSKQNMATTNTFYEKLQI